MTEAGLDCSLSDAAALTRRAVLAAAGGCTVAPAFAQTAAAPIDRAHFPTIGRATYLDAAHRAPPPQFAVEAGRLCLDDLASGRNRLAFGQEAIEAARATLGEALGAPAREIAFMPNTHHGLNMALWSIGLEEGDAVLIPEQEYNGVQSIARLLVAQGMKAVATPVDMHGRIDLAALKQLLAQKPKAMIFSWVGFSHGARADIDAIGALCRSFGVRCIVDGIQAVGLASRPLSSLPVDAVACGSHKALMGPPGTGFLWVPAGSLEHFRPLVGGRGTFTTENGVGGDLFDDSRRFEFGNFNNIGIAMLAASCREIGRAGIDRIDRHVTGLCRQLYSVVARTGFPIVTPSSPAERLNIVTIEAGAQATALHERLRERDVVISRQASRLRFSLGAFNTEADIDQLGAMIA